MYDFHCSYMKKKYGGNFKLLMTDIDSLMYEIETDFYKDTKDDISEKFDSSKFPEKRLSGIHRLNENFPGMLKDECGNHIFKTFRGLRANLYAYKVDEGHEEKTQRCKKICCSKRYELW